MNIITIVNARPPFIKAAAVSAALVSTPTVRERLLHTGRHFDDSMSEVPVRPYGDGDAAPRIAAWPSADPAA